MTTSEASRLSDEWARRTLHHVVRPLNPSSKRTRRRVGPRRAHVALAALLAVLGLLSSHPALARARSALPYGSSNVWAAAVRFLRVDRGLPIREKDEAAGYVLFDFAEGGKSYHGALELVPLAGENNAPSTQISLSIPGLPKRYEAALLEQLAAKVREERGPAEPPPRRAPPPAAEKEQQAKDRDTDREKADREKDKGAPKSPATIDPSGLPRAPTLPSP